MFLGLLAAIAWIILPSSRATAQPSPWPPSREPKYVPREVLVFPVDLRSTGELRAAMREAGMHVLMTAPMSGMIVAVTPLEALEEAYCVWLRTVPGVRDAALNPVVVSTQPDCPAPAPTLNSCIGSGPHTAYPDLKADCPTCPASSGSVCAWPSGVPDDEAFCFQWGLLNVGQALVDRSCHSFSPQCWSQTAVSGVDVNVWPAWAVTQGDPRVTVAVLDKRSRPGVSRPSRHGGVGRVLRPWTHRHRGGARGA